MPGKNFPRKMAQLKPISSSNKITKPKAKASSSRRRPAPVIPANRPMTRARRAFLISSGEKVTLLPPGTFESNRKPNIAKSPMKMTIAKLGFRVKDKGNALEGVRFPRWEWVAQRDWEEALPGPGVLEPFPEYDEEIGMALIRALEEN